jgi:hypothetical protein
MFEKIIKSLKVLKGGAKKRKILKRKKRGGDGESHDISIDGKEYLCTPKTEDVETNTEEVDVKEKHEVVDDDDILDDDITSSPDDVQDGGGKRKKRRYKKRGGSSCSGGTEPHLHTVMSGGKKKRKKKRGGSSCSGGTEPHLHTVISGGKKKRGGSSCSGGTEPHLHTVMSGGKKKRGGSSCSGGTEPHLHTVMSGGKKKRGGSSCSGGTEPHLHTVMSGGKKKRIVKMKVALKPSIKTKKKLYREYLDKKYTKEQLLKKCRKVGIKITKKADGTVKPIKKKTIIEKIIAIKFK